MSEPQILRRMCENRVNKAQRRFDRVKRSKGQLIRITCA